MNTIKSIFASVIIRGENRTTYFDVYYDEELTYFAPVTDSIFSVEGEPDIRIQYRMYFKLSETQPDPANRPGCLFHPKLFDLKDSSWAVIEEP